jgi:hypothetical protein
MNATAVCQGMPSRDHPTLTQDSWDERATHPCEGPIPIAGARTPRVVRLHRDFLEEGEAKRPGRPSPDTRVASPFAAGGSLNP